MNFKDEMIHIFVQAIKGEVEPEAWEKWWDNHIEKLRETLLLGDLERMEPSEQRPLDYRSMVKCQQGIAYYFYRQGKPQKCSDYYEIMAKQQEKQKRQDAMKAYHDRMKPLREQWEHYLAGHPTAPIAYDWIGTLGTPPGQTSFVGNSNVQKNIFQRDKNISVKDKRVSNREEMHQRLKENMSAKIAPLTKAYGMKSAGPKTFVRERNGIVSYVSFTGYFRGGGYESMTCYLGPLYSIDTGLLNLPVEVYQTDIYLELKNNWGDIQYDLEGVSAEKINCQFDRILTLLAEEVLPRWQQIDSLEAFFAPERQAYFGAAMTGPLDTRTNRPLWEIKSVPHPWHADDYLFGVWDLLCGREEAGYERLARCVEYANAHRNADWYTWDYNNPKDHLAVYCHNAELFYQTREQANADSRRQAIKETYEQVCHFMRYYYKLSKRVTR